jgi:hypothetical protein
MIKKTAPIIVGDTQKAGCHGCGPCSTGRKPSQRTAGTNTSGLTIQHVERAVLDAETRLK